MTQFPLLECHYKTAPLKANAITISADNLHFIKVESTYIDVLKANIQLKIVSEGCCELHYVLYDACPRTGEPNRMHKTLETTLNVTLRHAEARGCLWSETTIVQVKLSDMFARAIDKEFLLIDVSFNGVATFLQTRKAAPTY